MTDDLDNLEARIQSAKGGKEKPAEPSEGAKALNAGMEFLSPILGGIFAGYFLDGWLETKPLFIISLFLLGVGAGFLNIYKLSQNVGGTVGFSELHTRPKNAKTSPSDDSAEGESRLDPANDND